MKVSSYNKRLTISFDGIHRYEYFAKSVLEIYGLVEEMDGKVSLRDALNRVARWSKVNGCNIITPEGMYSLQGTIDQIRKVLGNQILFLYKRHHKKTIKQGLDPLPTGVRYKWIAPILHTAVTFSSEDCSGGGSKQILQHDGGNYSISGKAEAHAGLGAVASADLSVPTSGQLFGFEPKTPNSPGITPVEQFYVYEADLRWYKLGRGDPHYPIASSGWPTDPNHMGRQLGLFDGMLELMNKGYIVSPRQLVDPATQEYRNAASRYENKRKEDATSSTAFQPDEPSIDNVLIYSVDVGKPTQDNESNKATKSSDYY